MKDALKGNVTKLSNKPSLTIDSNPHSPSTKANPYYSTDSYLESLYTIIPYKSNGPTQKTITSQCASKDRQRTMSERIKRKIRQINAEMFQPKKLSRINSPPYENSKRNIFDSAQEYISVISPLKRKRNNCLSDILNCPQNNIKVIKGLMQETKKEVQRKVEKEDMIKFKEQLMSPPVVKKLIGVLALGNIEKLTHIVKSSSSVASL